MLSAEAVQTFQQTVLDYYYDNQRILPWREPDGDHFDAYKIMVSEIMLQQTQVPRVIEKYQQFLEVFPDVTSLAQSSLGDVLTVWQGLGYNRRGRFLREAAAKVMTEFEGAIPRSVDELVSLPGIGHNTASAILVYAYNQPLVFIETNIRTVYLHHFFEGLEEVSDKEILELVAQTLDESDPRNWYWALMDYGTYIKKTFGNPNLRSKHYHKQSKFEGSKRQIRGRVLQELAKGRIDERELVAALQDSRAEDVINDLIKEQLIIRLQKHLEIAP